MPESIDGQEMHDGAKRRRPPTVPLRVLAGVGAVALLVFGVALPYILLGRDATVEYSVEPGVTRSYVLTTSATWNGDYAEVERSVTVSAQGIADEDGRLTCKIDVRLGEDGPRPPAWIWPEARGEGRDFDLALSALGPTADYAAAPWRLWDVWPWLALPRVPGRALPADELWCPPMVRFYMELPTEDEDAEPTIILTTVTEEFRIEGREPRSGVDCVRIDRRWRLSTVSETALAAQGAGKTWMAVDDGHVVEAKTNVTGRFESAEREHTFGRTDNLTLLPLGSARVP